MGMNFIDDETNASQDDDVLVPSSQRDVESSEAPRASKRRRLNPFSESSGGSSSQAGDYELPSDNPDSEDEVENPKSKYDNYMHVPAHVDTQQDQFLTQVDQPSSSPAAIRGPRWRKKSPTPPPLSPPPPVRLPLAPIAKQPPAIAKSVFPSISTSNSIVVDEFDDEDDDFLEALLTEHDLQDSVNADGLTSQSADRNTIRSTVARQLPKTMRQTTLFGMKTTQKTPPRNTQPRAHNWRLANQNETPTHHQINRDSMKTWKYPLNVGSIRDYQFNIVHRALFHNILVALPTGLGKTFIAATVMLNYFDWTKDAQIVFVAPTKPLVTQQVDACYHIAGIPRSQTTLLTGEIPPGIRAEEWQEKRVFFMTPQTLVNDLKTGMADPKKIVLLVVDEAHKATGNYAYVEVVRFLRRFNTSFRILALTATPGATVESVQKVIDGLGIARVEIRTEESMDIRSFVHTRNTEIKLFDNSEEIDLCLDLFADAVRPVLNKVNSLNAYYSNEPKTMTAYGLVKGREQWAKSDAGRKADWGLKSMVNACFKPLMTLAHNLELLKYHGIGPFYHKMKLFDEEALEKSGKYIKQIVESDGYKKLMSHLRTWINKDDFVGHPKLSYLSEVVLNHFMDAGNGLGQAAGRPPSDTRIMIFAHYRDSAEEIVRVLNRHEPMIRARVFVGQAGTKGSEGMDQKTQIDVIKKFKAGTFNTLVATSIGEEGLDIGEVDLIVCYDCSKSPVRMLQRMGRTGRKRSGNIVLLLMRGKEERDYHSAKDNYLKMQEIIEDGSHFEFHDNLSPRIVPREIQPVVDKRIVEIPFENTQLGALEPRKRKAKSTKRPPKKFHMPDGVETGFSFLGGGGSKKQATKKMSKPKPALDLDTSELPLLNAAILSSQEERELDERYAQVAGSETVYVQPVRFDTHPTQIHYLTGTIIVKHSKLTKSLVSASGKMRSPGSNWDRPTQSIDIENLSSEDEGDAHASRRAGERQARNNVDVDGTTSRKRPQPLVSRSNKPKAKSTHTAKNHIPNRFSETDDDDDDDCGRPHRRHTTRRLPINQSLEHEEEEEEDLPELSAIFDVSKDDAIVIGKDLDIQPPPTTTKSTTSRLKRPNARRVISDDDDDDDSDE